MEKIFCINNEKLEEMGEKVPTGFFESIKNWFAGIGDWFKDLFNNNDKDLGILETTNDNLLGDNVVVDATDKDAIKLPTAEETKGFFEKIWNWFTDLFNNDSESNQDNTNENSNDENTVPIIGGDSSSSNEDNLNTEDINDESIAKYIEKLKQYEI